MLHSPLVLFWYPMFSKLIYFRCNFYLMFLVTTRTTKLLQQWPKSLLLQIQTWSNLAHALAKRPVSIQLSAFSSITGWLTALCRLVKYYANCTTTITLRNVSLLCANVLEVQYNQSTWHFRQQMKTTKSLIEVQWNELFKMRWAVSKYYTEQTIKFNSTMEKFIISISRIYLLVRKP